MFKKFLFSRFGKDLDVGFKCNVTRKQPLCVQVIDQLLIMNFRYVMQTISEVTQTLVTISVTTPIFIGVAALLSIAYYLILRLFIPTNR